MLFQIVLKQFLRKNKGAKIQKEAVEPLQPSVSTFEVAWLRSRHRPFVSQYDAKWLVKFYTFRNESISWARDRVMCRLFLALGFLSFINAASRKYYVRFPSLPPKQGNFHAIPITGIWSNASSWSRRVWGWQPSSLAGLYRDRSTITLKSYLHCLACRPSNSF